MTVPLSRALGILFASLFVVVCATTGWAVTAINASEELLDLSIEELQAIQVKTVAGASKYEQKVTEAPSSITIIASDDIRKFGYRTLSDIIKSVRGFYVSYDRNYSYYGVRGFSRPGDYNTRLLLMVDGHRMNENVYEQAPLGTEFPLDIDLIDRVEIIRGPGSSLYGSNAFFGVINIITKKAKAIGGSELAASAASFDAYAGRATFGAELPSGTGMLLSGSAYDSKGRRNLYYPEFDAPGSNNGVATDRDGDRQNTLFAKICYQDFMLEGIYGRREKMIPTGSFGAVFNDPANRSIDENASLDLTYRRDIRNGAAAMARVYYDHKYYQEDYLLDYPPLTRNRDTANGAWWGGEIQITAVVRERHKVTAGAEYKDNLRQDQRNVDLTPQFTYIDDKRRSRVWAAYIQDEYRMQDNLILNIGLRSDTYSDFGSATNPRIGLIYAPTEKTTLKLLYGSAFRAPNVYELYYADGVTAIANPNLKPETIRTYEAIYEQYIGDHIRTSVSAFAYRIQNLIMSVPNVADGMSQFQNADETIANGLEMEAEVVLHDGFTGRISYTLQKAKDGNTGEVLTNSPAHLAKLNAVLPIVKDSLFLDPEVQYTCRRNTMGGNVVPEYTIVNLTLLYRASAKGLDVSLSAYNLANTSYSDPSAGLPQHVQDAIAQDGRNYRIKLAYRF